MTIVLLVLAVVLILREAWNFDKWQGLAGGLKHYLFGWVRFIIMWGLIFLAYISAGGEALGWFALASFFIPVVLVKVFGETFSRLKLKK